MEKNILIVGVGGQGTLLASVLLGNLALQKDYDVKLSERGLERPAGTALPPWTPAKASSHSLKPGEPLRAGGNRC